MTATLRSLFLLSACVVSAACLDQTSAAPKPAPSVPAQETRAKAPEPKSLLGTNEALLAATAPVAPASIAEPKAAEPKPMEGKSPSAELESPKLTSASATSDAMVDYERPLTPEEVKIDRFVLARGVDQREPVDESDVFAGDEKIFAFVQLKNPDTAPFSFRVHWEPVDGPVSPYGVALKVETAARFRTWSWTAIPREPGQYKAVLRTLDGAELASRTFTIE
jgi:hypothetical protein